MKAEFGINLPQFFVDSEIPLLTIGRFAEQAEEAGFHSLWTLERFIGRVKFIDPLILLAYIAAHTEKIKLGTAVLRTPLRTPLILANAVASLDNLSSGRVILGMGVGGVKEEFDGCGVKFGERARRFEEGLELMKSLWARDDVDFDNGIWRLEKVTVEPKPIQKPHPPIWIGASKLDGPLKRVARLADGWLGAGASTLQHWIEAWKKIQEYAREYGRDIAKIERAKRIYLHIDDDGKRAKKKLAKMLGAFYQGGFDVESKCVYGSTSKVANSLEKYVAAGVRVFVLNTVDDHLHQLKLLIEDILPSFR